MAARMPKEEMSDSSQKDKKETLLLTEYEISTLRSLTTAQVKERYTTNLHSLASGMDELDGVLALLVTKKVLTTNLRDEIEAKPTPFSRKVKLIDCLSKRSAEDFIKFVDIMRQTSQNEELIKALINGK